MATTGTPGIDAMFAQIMSPLSHLGMMTRTNEKRIDDYFKKKAQEFSLKCKRHGELVIRFQKYKMYMDANMCPKEIQGLVRKEIPPEHYNTGHETQAQTAMIQLRLAELTQQTLASQRSNIEPIETPQNECLFMFNSFLDKAGVPAWSHFEEAKQAFMNVNRGFIVDYALEQAELYNTRTFTATLGKMMKRLDTEQEKLKKFLDKLNVDIQIDDDQENNIEYIKEAHRREIEKLKKRLDKTDALLAKLLPGGQKSKSTNAGTKKNQKANGKQGKKQKPGNGQAKGKNARKDKPNQGKSIGKAAPRKRSSDADFRDADNLVSKYHTKSSDADSDDGESNDTEILNLRHSLELMDLGNNDSTLKEVPKLDGDLRSISDSSEDEENDLSTDLNEKSHTSISL